MAMHERLKEAAAAELLEAAIWFYTQHADRPEEVERFLRLGFMLAQPNGWRHIAPAWVAAISTGGT